ncbi:MAG: DUF4340 domain-containing protein [Clostridia bacterium]|nr:DUF4340 domain-containing protein [Clostridia bacterium]MBR5768172.1 DUF4340 domain-containing protein [Clostridia bacterium]
MSKKLVSLIVVASIVVLLIPTYFVVSKLLAENPGTNSEPAPELLPGEVLGLNNRILLFEHVEKADMYTIEVHNPTGTYTFYRGSDDNFYIRGMESVSYSLEALSSLVVSSGYTLSMRRLEFEETEDLSSYGLAPENDPAWYVVTKMDGTEHKVLIGDRIPTGGGYYCTYDGRERDGRPVVYILDTSLAVTLLNDVHNLISPSLTWPVSTASYYGVDDFIIIKNGELYVHIDMMSPEETGKDLPSYKLIAPEGYNVNLSTYSAMLETFSDFSADLCVKAGKELSDITEEQLLADYGIDIENPYYEISYTVDGITSIAVFSEPDETGVFYAFSSVYNTICRMTTSSEDAAFLGWGLLKFVDNYVFASNINDVAKVAIKGSLDEKNTRGEDIDVDCTFTLDGEGETLLVYENSKTTAYDADNLKIFRQLYKDFLNLKLIDYVDEGHESKDTLLLELSFDYDDGNHLDYKFYSYSTRRCFYTVNGVGEFYVMRSLVEKVIRDADRMLHGEQIVAENKD